MQTLSLPRVTLGLLCVAVLRLGAVQAGEALRDDVLPFAPLAPRSVLPAVVSGTAFTVGFTGHRQLTPLFFLGQRADPAMSAFKGAFGERVLSESMSRGVLHDTQRWIRITPARNAAGNGIDHILVRTNAAGNFLDTMIVESKAFGSQIGMTRNGPQMSRQWLAAHLRESSNTFRTLSSRVSRATTAPQLAPFRNMPDDALEMAMGNNRRLAVWMDGDEIRYASGAGLLTKSDIKRALLHTAFGLEGMAQGNVPYQAGIFRITTDAKGTNFVLSRRLIDPATNMKIPGSTQRWIVPAFTKPGTPEQQLIRDSLRTELGKRFGNNSVIADDVLERATSDPAYLRRMTMKANLPLRAMVRRSVALAGIGGVVAGGFDLGLQIIAGDEINLEQVAKTAITGAAAGFVGSVVSDAATYVTATSKIARNLLTVRVVSEIYNNPFMPKFLYGMAGGLGAAATFAYLPYLFGWSDLSTANTNFVVGSATALGFGLASGGLMTLAALGTTGTGAAIGSLSGAAATSASLAWLGGGAAAAGGGGVALGAKVLVVSRVAGAAIIAGTFIYMGYDAIVSESGRRAMIDKEFEWRKERVFSDAVHTTL